MTTKKQDSKPRFVKTDIKLLDGIVSIYAGTRVSKALHEVTIDMDIYKGVRLAELLEAVYEQGKKDGARLVFEKVTELTSTIPHKNPGRPRKK